MGGRGSKSSRSGAGAAGGAEGAPADLPPNASAAQVAEFKFRSQLSGSSRPPTAAQAAELNRLQQDAKASGGLISNSTRAVVKPGFEAEHRALGARGIKIGNTAYQNGKPIGRIVNVGNKGGNVVVDRPSATARSGNGMSISSGGRTSYLASDVQGKP